MSVRPGGVDRSRVVDGHADPAGGNDAIDGTEMFDDEHVLGLGRQVVHDPGETSLAAINAPPIHHASVRFAGASVLREKFGDDLFEFGAGAAACASLGSSADWAPGMRVPGFAGRAFR